MTRPLTDDSTDARRRTRLLVIVNVFHPDRGGGAAVFSDLCFSLQERGFDVSVRCAYPYYPEWTDKTGENGLRRKRYTERGVRIERYGLFIPGNPQALIQRLLYEASFMLSLSRSLFRRRDYDVVMVFCPLVGAVAFAGLNRWFHRAPVWLNVQDLSAEAAEASGISRLPLTIEIMRSVQRFLFNKADVWSTISPVMARRLGPHRRKAQPLALMPNWLNETLAGHIRALPDKAGRSPGRPVRLLYAGNIGNKQDLLKVCRTLSQSSAPFDFSIHGNGSAAESVQRWVAASGDERFRFGPFLNEAEFAGALHDADLFVISEIRDSGGAFIPSKMIPGMASQTPILAICDKDSPLGQEMAEAQPGYHAEWDDLADVVDLLRRLGSGDNVEDFAERQKRATARAALYDRDRIIDQFGEALRAAAEGRRIPPGLLTN